MPKLNPYLQLILLSLVLFLPGIASLPVIDRDEAHFAQATRQMLQTDSYFQIRFQEKTRFQKPPGINWLQAASVSLFSHADANAIWPYRIPSFLGALLAVLLTFYFTSQFIPEQTALLASAFLASSLLLVVEAHMAVIDTSLLSSVVLMQGALWMIYHAGYKENKAYWGWALIFWLAMAYGFVLKGVTPLVGVLSIVTLCVIDKRIRWLRGLHLFWGLGLFLALSLTWLFLVNVAEQSNYLLQMVHKDLLPKLQGGHESHGKPPLFHLAILPLTLWPASLFLWQGVAYAFKEKHQPIVKFLLAWIIPTWVFFELMPTKLPQYVLPTFPAITLLLALGIQASQSKREQGKWLRILQVLWGVLTIGLAIFLLILPYLVMHQVTFSAIFIFWVLCILGVTSVYFAWKGRYKPASYSVLLAALLSYPLIFSCLLPELRPVWISHNIAEVIHPKAISEENPLFVVGYGEPSLVFYLNTKNVLFTDENVALNRLNQSQGLLLIDEENFAKLAHYDGLTILARIHGFNYSKGKWVKLLLVEGKNSPSNNNQVIEKNRIF
ncbi:ArnT family glycosyltransferase [Legionella impletisoli]|uniref:Glycosyl transferase n=1 Tax=Legionella impletisoli TaxID=343510 RepID=A0A917JP77_9GAMM|nr:glycosyltransferase family 39 protein [Legionella impletisoli]GGI79807.1 glycosyl transferase [Legionella impletisoli]